MSQPEQTGTPLIDDEECELIGLWLSRLMFGWVVGMPEDRSYEEWLRAVEASR